MSIDFVAIDFETANSFRGSPCAIGVVVVKNGQIVDERNLLMRPPGAIGPNDFENFNVGMHGISWEKVKDEPFFDEIWQILVPLIGDLPLIAHNAAFDIGVLRDSLDESDVPWPELNYACTLVTSRRLLKLPSYSLPFVAAELQVRLEKHHDALADARTAAQIMLELCQRKNQTSLDELLQYLNIGWGKISEGNWQGSTVRDKTRRGLPAPRQDADESHFLFAKRIVITGALPSGISRAQAQERIAYFGGIAQENVTKETGLLVIGDLDSRTLAPGSVMSGKMKKAFQLQDDGFEIEIMTGTDFLPLLD